MEDEYLWAKTEWAMLAQSYKIYLSSYLSATPAKQALMDAALAEMKPVSTGCLPPLFGKPAPHPSCISSAW